MDNADDGLEKLQVGNVRKDFEYNSVVLMGGDVVVLSVIDGVCNNQSQQIILVREQ